MTGESKTQANGAAIVAPCDQPADNHSDSHHTQTQAHHHGSGFKALMLGALGVVFGDIGTSPLYAMRVALEHTKAGEDTHIAVFGIISLVFWALFLLVTIKYVTFLMRADNKGEGGTLALMALVQKALGHNSRIIFFLAICGASLFYGDSIITPALTVMGAVEGLKLAPEVENYIHLNHVKPEAVTHTIVLISLIILIGLFMVQSKGTEKVARFFGPIMAVWFVVMAIMGLTYIGQRPEILMALSPYYGIAFLIDNGLLGFVILGSVFLVVTGAEALYADMGHFGRKPINAAWLFVAFPSLMLNYLGQGALILVHPEAIKDPFWNMVPHFAYWPILILATFASIIGSQAVISGAYSNRRCN